MSVNEDIMFANKIINGKVKEKIKIFHNNSSVYKFTNENISSYYDLLNLKDKNILTVCSSGDHVLEAILKDVKKVDCFDISIFTKYFMNLKLASVLTLDYIEFFNYLLNKTNIRIFAYEIYIKIRPVLKQIDFDSLIFWDNLYSNKRGFEIFASNLFMHIYIDISIFQEQKTSYLNKEQYYVLKQKLEKYLSLNNKINFEQLDIKALSKKYKEQYDLIFLSNIASYMEDIYRTNPETKFYNLITKEMKNLLTKNGLIGVAYLYSNVTLKDFVNDCLKNSNFDIVTCDSLYKDQKSYVLTYKN